MKNKIAHSFPNKETKFTSGLNSIQPFQYEYLCELYVLCLRIRSVLRNYFYFSQKLEGAVLI